MLIETIVVGPLGVNCLILGDKQSNEGVVIDPGADCEMILAAVARLGLKVKYLINTHQVGAQLRPYRGGFSPPRPFSY